MLHFFGLIQVSPLRWGFLRSGFKYSTGLYGCYLLYSYRWYIFHMRMSLTARDEFDTDISSGDPLLVDCVGIDGRLTWFSSSRPRPFLDQKYAAPSSHKTEVTFKPQLTCKQIHRSKPHIIYSVSIQTILNSQHENDMDVLHKHTQRKFQ